jgi:hypothetical protein
MMQNKCKYTIITATMLLVIATTGCSSKSDTPSTPPADSQVSASSTEETNNASGDNTEKDWPPEAVEAIGAILTISENITPTEPPDVERNVAYNGTEAVDGKDCYSFTVYADLPDRYENLGIYLKQIDDEVYYFYNIAADEYVRIVIGDTGIFLDGDARAEIIVPEIEMTHQIYDNDFIIEIAQIINTADSSAIDVINKEIMDFSADALKAYDEYDGVYWYELKTYPFTDRDYVQIVMTGIEYPTYGTDGQVRSFNYCPITDEVYTLEDAVIAHGLSEEKLSGALLQSGLLEDHQSVGALKICGFRMLENGQADFYITALINSTESEGWDSIFTYHMEDETFERYDKESLIENF